MKKTALLIALMCALSACNVSVHSNGKVTRYNLLDEAVKAVKAPSEKKKALNKELAQAVFDDDINKARSLIAQGADVNARTNDNKNFPLQFVKSTGMAELLLENKGNPNLTDNQGDNALDNAHFKGRCEIATYFKNRGVKGQNLNDLLFRVVESYKEEYAHSYAKNFIKCGADVNAKHKDGYSPLELALNKGKTDTAKTLIELGAKMNTEKQKELAKEMLFSAVESNNTALVRSLIKQGANPDARDKDKQTPLMVLAFHHDNTEIAQALLDGGADIEATDKQGDTPLAEAVWGGKPNLTRFLIAKGAKVNDKRSSDGLTPLHQTAYNYPPDNLPSITTEGRMSAIKILIENKANVNAKDNQGKTPLDYAREKAPSDIENLLKKYGAKHSDAYIAQQKADKERAKREEQEYARKRKCEHVYVGKEFKREYEVLFTGKGTATYIVLGFSPKTGEVTARCEKMCSFLGGYGSTETFSCTQID